jgi:hypothetical protein
MLDLDTVTRIAESYIIGLSRDAGVELAVHTDRTVEREYGWVFFYGPKDGSTAAAGNAPFIVDRNDGSVYRTGTAFPTETYLDNYARTGRTFPRGDPENTVVIEGWTRGKPGIAKISLTKAIRAATGYGLAEAKARTDAIITGHDAVLMFPSEAEADLFCKAVRTLGASARREFR